MMKPSPVDQSRISPDYIAALVDAVKEMAQEPLLALVRQTAGTNVLFDRHEKVPRHYLLLSAINEELAKRHRVLWSQVHNAVTLGLLTQNPVTGEYQVSMVAVQALRAAGFDVESNVDYTKVQLYMFGARRDQLRIVEKKAA